MQRFHPAFHGAIYIPHWCAVPFVGWVLCYSVLCFIAPYTSPNFRSRTHFRSTPYVSLLSSHATGPKSNFTGAFICRRENLDVRLRRRPLQCSGFGAAQER